MTFLARPSFGAAARMAEEALMSSGIVEARYAKELLSFQYLPEFRLPQVNLDPANAGPLYFALVLTLGVVVPALR